MCRRRSSSRTMIARTRISLGTLGSFAPRRVRAAKLAPGTDSALLGKVVVGSGGVNHAVLDRQRHAIEKLTAGARRSGDALSGRRFIIGAMRRTHQIASALGEELIVHPIHRHRNMPALVNVGVQSPPVVDDETFLLNSAYGQQK